MLLFTNQDNKKRFPHIVRTKKVISSSLDSHGFSNQSAKVQQIIWFIWICLNSWIGLSKTWSKCKLFFEWSNVKYRTHLYICMYNSPCETSLLLRHQERRKNSISGIFCKTKLWEWFSFSQIRIMGKGNYSNN